MTSYRGGFYLASVALLAIAAPRFDGEGGDGGAAAGGGGASDLLDDDGAAAAAAAAAAGGAGGEGGQGGAGGEGGQGGDPPAVAEWMKSFSGEKAGDEPSNQEWLARLGVKDLDGLAKIARDNQRALRESGRVKIPGENATDEERAAFREAIGAPKEASGYEVALPEAAKDYEIDAGFLDPMREIAHKHGVPAAAFKELADKFMESQLESAVAEAARHDTDRDAKFKEWGAEAEARKEEFRRGAQILGLKKSDIADIQSGFGAGRTLDLVAKIGNLAGEDFFAGGGAGGGAQRFGVASAADAQKALDGMMSDKATADALRAKDPVAMGRWNRLIEAKSHFQAREAKGRG